ncbi:hypothetical protein D9758_000577 [Tetrapyrgos nigripes]|uniref:Uncharacterized protein n=1 Tax=Tetrapyrgos nigripes TaxID=182062 RepID=A0A8H5GZF2_9AGAR|nr:hypothetical protein D9758_000577 [Tetrapyrgos nigripes]
MHRPRLSLLDVPSTWAQEAKHSVSLQTPSSPVPPTPMHVRRKTYAGDLNTVSRDVIREFEGRIALLESRNARMSVELEQTRDALSDEREERKIERHSLILPSLPPPTELDGYINEQSELLYERRLRVEILETLKKIRAQNTVLSRELREHKDKSTSLAGILDAEREEKEHMREEISRLSQKNFTLFEHNKLLVGRDSALQEQICTLVTKSQADDWMRSVLEAELRKARQDLPDSPTSSSNPEPPPTITLEDQGPLRCQLVAAQDELHIAHLRLQASEKKCKELDERVLGLQQNMSRCLDSSSKALEMERGIRVELVQRAVALEEENIALKHEMETANFELESLRQSCISLPDDPAVVERSQLLENENEQLKEQMDTMTLQLGQLRRRQRVASRADELVSENEHLKGRLTALEKELDNLHWNSNKPSTKLQTPNLNQRPICGDVQKVTVGVLNLSRLQDPSEAKAGNNDPLTLKLSRRERLLDRQLRLATSKRLCRRRRKREQPGLLASSLQTALSLPLITEDTTPGSSRASLDSLDIAPLSLFPSPTLFSPAQTRSSPLSSSPKRKDIIPPTLDTSTLPSRSASPFPSMYGTPTPSTLHQAIPKAPFPTPIGEFSSGAPFSHLAPDSPDSFATTSTLVSSSPSESFSPQMKAIHRKSVLLVTALSNKKPLFERDLKSASTLSVTTEIDVNNAKPVKFKRHKAAAKYPKEVHKAHMRRASVVLADVARTYCGIENRDDDWLII